MGNFRHHPDGIIYIDDFSETLAEFLIDETVYSLPPGYIGREYWQGTRDLLYTSDSAFAAIMPWPDGDIYITNKAKYQAAYIARHAPPPPTPQQIADAANLADVNARWRAYQALHNKTPEQIYALVQGQIDGWTTLAQAKTALREWLPLLIAAVAWVVMTNQQRD